MKTITTDEVSVYLTVGGQILHEYDDEDATLGNTASSYIEAMAGSHFGVRIDAQRTLPKTPQDCIELQTYLDGKLACARVIEVSTSYTPIYSYTLSGIERNTSHGRVTEKFTFAHLTTSDEPTGNLKKDSFKDMGEVTVKCLWVRKTGQPTVNTETERFESAFGSSVPEKCLKGRAISNKASVGAAELSGGAPLMNVVCSWPYGKEPFATFRFKYRSRRDLQIEGIIERSPSPTPLEDRDPDDLTPEEARELVRRMRERQQEQPSIKREVKREKRARSPTVIGDDDSDDEEVTVTNAGPSRKRTRLSNDSGIEVVDLTDD